MASARTTAALLVYAGFSLAALTWRHALGASALHDGAPLGGAHVIALPLALSLGALSGVAVVGLTRALVARASWAASLESALRDGLTGATPRELRWLALAAAVGEELLFRGAMLPTVAGWINFPAAALLTAALFGLLHIPANRALRPWTVSAFVMGLLFALLYRVTGEVLAPLTAHAVINLENLELLLRPAPSRGAPAAPRRSSATGPAAAPTAAGSRPAPGG
jgi:membrane protease YdiL (CAAX protease family)